jgi:hypothetical protein
MQDKSSSLLVSFTQGQTSKNDYIPMLKRPRSPSEDTNSYKSQPSQDFPKREFYQKLGSGVVKIIWIIRDLDYLINNIQENQVRT